MSKAVSAKIKPRAAAPNADTSTATLEAHIRELARRLRIGEQCPFADRVQSTITELVSAYAAAHRHQVRK